MHKINKESFILALNAQNQRFVINVKDFGAIGDGKTMNTNAIQKAIDKCAVTGGLVYLPAGTYLSGSLEIKSNVSLHISAGATLLGSTNIADYDQHRSDESSYNDAFLRHSLLYAENAENITITGRGIIDGQGGSFVVTTKKKPERYKNRPYVIRFVNVKMYWWKISVCRIRPCGCNIILSARM
jgi:polygalacturonase